jgi:UDP-2,4-diacetamido-2,4,6-trideoxy-beta-L-altropyranose hydrolase
MTSLIMNRVPTTKLLAVTLRAAAPEDCESIWRWNFAPDVRARSKSPDVVSFVQHARWFTRRLAEGKEPIWIVETLAGPVGVVRLDMVSRGLARISIALAPASRGNGVGRQAISAVCQRWNQPIIAEILADNLASRACFEACGFRSVVECDGLLTYHWEPHGEPHEETNR